tara:strand:- start:2323 stop:3189 length:867 start_codon:yes stop_codon:yes gene_type:complete
MARNNELRTGASAAGDSTGAVSEAVANASPLSFVVPTEFVELPSRGRYYPEDHPLCNQEVVEIRHMTAKDEDILTSASLLKKGLAIDRLIASILVDKNISPDTLLIGDRNAILLQARIHAYTSNYGVTVGCPACGESSEQTFDLAECGLNYGEDLGALTDDISGPDSQNMFDIRLPVTQVVAKVRLLNAGLEKSIANEQARRQKMKLPEAPVTFQLKQIIYSLNGETDRNQVNTFIESMPTADTHYLRASYNKLVPNVDMTQSFTCPNCEKESQLEVPFTAEFFWPNR